MRFPFALVVLGVFVAGTIAAQASEADASCASTFTALSQSARDHGIFAQDFDHMAAVAARHGGTATAAGQAESRALPLSALAARVVNCHARYDGKSGDLRVASN